MAKKNILTPDQQIRQLQMELAEKEHELDSYRGEVAKINLELEKFIDQVDTELKLAQVIQRTLVPTEIPTIPGFTFSTKFIPSRIAGGDYFDIFEFENPLYFGVLMANSSGHGMASLFLSVLLKLTAQIEARKNLAPHEVLSRMYQEIKVNMKPTDRSHIFYAVIDRKTYDMTFSKAGDMAAFLYKHSHDKVVKLDTGGAALQAAPSKEGKNTFKSEAVGLESRDKLILVSCGAFSVKNKEGEEFSETQLCQTILDHAQTGGSHDLRNEILFQIAKHAEGNEGYPQDVTCLVMRVKDKVIKLKVKK